MRVVTAVLWGALPMLVLGACAREPRAPGAAAISTPPQQVCMDFSFPVYFDTNSGQLTPAAQQVVADAASRVKGCVLGRIDVVGLADATGGAAVNLAVSRRRAQAVADALAGAGLPRPSFDIDAIGAVGATTPEGQPEPLRRRTEVVVRASPPAS
jgi:peptidoglycan-associated lipoprotein